MLLIQKFPKLFHCHQQNMRHWTVPNNSRIHSNSQTNINNNSDNKYSIIFPTLVAKSATQNNVRNSSGTRTRANCLCVDVGIYIFFAVVLRYGQLFTVRSALQHTTGQVELISLAVNRGYVACYKERIVRWNEYRDVISVFSLLPASPACIVLSVTLTNQIRKEHKTSYSN